MEARNITQDGILVIYEDGRVFNNKTKKYLTILADGSVNTKVNGIAYHFSVTRKLNELFPENYVSVNEIYKDIKGFEGLYQISNFGNVRSFVRNRILKHKIDVDGYCLVNLYKNKKCTTLKVHRLVAEHFIHPSNLTVNHIDFDKTNNSVPNLQYMSNVDNIKDAWINGRYNTDKFIKRKKLA